MPFLRYDKGRLDAAQMTAQGYLKADAFATRAGVFTYLTADGSTRRELRPPEEVFNPDSLSSLADVAVTNDHPPEALHSENTKKYAVGWTSDKVDRENQLVKVKVNVTDSKTIKDIFEGAKQELSCGYYCDVEHTPGEWNGERYDAIQRNIRYNHLAVVAKGRAGPEARIKLDAQDAMMADDEKKDGRLSENAIHSEKQSKQEEQNMPAKIKIDAVEYEVSETVAQVVTAKFDAAAKVSQELASAQKQIETLTGKTDGLNAELKKRDDEIAALKAATPTDKEILARADALSKVHSFAKKVLGDSVKTDEMEISAIKKAVVQKTLPSVKVDEKSAEYVDGVFDSLYQKDADAAGNPLKEAIGATVNKSDAVVSAAEARKRSMQQDSQAWKNEATKH